MMEINIELKDRKESCEKFVFAGDLKISQSHRGMAITDGLGPAQFEAMRLKLPRT
jgi:hypothetical protein